MSEILSQLSKKLLDTCFENSLHLSCLSIFRCYKPQKLRHVSFNQPTLLMVVRGHKQVKINDKNLIIEKGELLLLPPGTTIWIGNFPDRQEEIYLGLGFRFDEEALKHFRLIYGSSLEKWDISPQWHTKVPDSISTALMQVVDLGHRGSTDHQLVQHRQVELLLLLAQEGLIGNILLGEHPSWKQRVSQLLIIEPARAWQLKEVCTRLGVSESSLRRKLQFEETGFRELLEEARLTQGLSLLLESKQSIGQISDAVGYQSQSRFGERFKRHFGMTPTELRRTLVA